MDTDRVVRRRRVAMIRLTSWLPETLAAIHQDMWSVGFGKTSVPEADLQALNDAMREATNVSSRIDAELPALFRSTDPDDLTTRQFDEVYTAFKRERSACFDGLMQLEYFLRQGISVPVENGGSAAVTFSLLYQTVDIDQPKLILKMAAEQIAECFPVDEAVEASLPVGTVIEEYHVGDKFENISHATIINRSTVDRAFNRYMDAGDSDVAVALNAIAEQVNQSGNHAAAALFDQFTSAVNEEAPDKSKARQYWDGLVAILPSVGSIAGATSVIASLFD
ncbi:hypothetical protein ACFWP5_04535 [Streptomyces sp. NPDC058469]|uniref:hypothetical protein n=1 Tax=Streptomyces sp. NPDC058469 TaxID=3346514 RepID=UPI0036685924